MKHETAEDDAVDREMYQSLNRELIYFTGPYIAYAVTVIGKLMHKLKGGSPTNSSSGTREKIF